MIKNSGMTLIEILIAISIIALIAGSMLTVFSFSTRRNMESEQVLSATFIAQRKIESLQTLDYFSALMEGNGERVSFSDYYIETVCTPYIPEDCHFFNIVLQDGVSSSSGCELYAIPPSGDTTFFLDKVSGDIEIVLSIVGDNYTLNMTRPKNLSLSGILPNDEKKVIVAINTTQYRGTAPISFHIDSGSRRVEAKVYDTSENSTILSVSGIPTYCYHNYTYRDCSMLRACVQVFDNETDLKPKAMIENILQLEN